MLQRFYPDIELLLRTSSRRLQRRNKSENIARYWQLALKTLVHNRTAGVHSFLGSQSMRELNVDE